MTFTPKAGVAQWRMIYDHLVTIDFDAVVTNVELAEVVGLNFRGPLQRATRELERHNRRTLLSVRGVGYRVAQANEHAGIGKTREGRARRQVKRGRETVVNTDLARLTAEEMKHHMRVEARLSAMESLMSQSARSTKSLAEQLQANLENTRLDNVILRGQVSQLLEDSGRSISA